jgi:acyl-CoA thioester hydrolase
MIHWTEVTLRPTDRDEVGHINNVVFAALVAAGRVDFITVRLEPHAAAGTDFWLARIELDYRRQLHYPGTVAVGTGVERMGRSSITLAHELKAKGETAASARSVLVHVELKSGKSLDLPEALRRSLDPA